MLRLRVTGYLKYYMPVGQHITVVQVFLHIYYCMVEIRQHCKGYPSSPMILFLTIAQAASNQKAAYDQCTSVASFKQG